MEDWKTAAQTFINQCAFYEDMDAVFLTGSHAAGNADKHSDIDLYIVLRDEVTWRERGTRRVNGFLIEYFANPARQIKQYIDHSYENVNIIEINMMLNGMVLLNKNNAAENIRAYCLQKDIRCFPALNEYQRQMGLYTIWDNYDELTRAFHNKTVDFTMQYHRFLLDAFGFYSRFIGSPIPYYHHIYVWLTDEKYYNTYGLPAYGDKIFMDMVKTAFPAADMEILYARAGEIKDYVFARAGGLNVDAIALRSPCDVERR